jgi:uncharacterized repeat protein (TIGR01451 family)
LLLSTLFAAGAAFQPPAADALPPGVEVDVEPLARQIRLEIPASEVVIAKTSAGAVADWRGGSEGSLAPGGPDLPLIPLVLWVDEGFRVTGVRVVSQKDVSLGTQAIAPVPVPVTENLDGELAPEERRPDPAIYGADEPYPATLARVQGEGWMRGRRIAYLTVTPVRSNPVSEALVLSTELVLEVTGEPDPARGLKPRPTPWEAQEEEDLRRFALDFRTVRDRQIPLESADPEAFWSPTYRPSLDGSPVEYVIVTNNAMAPAFQVLADWKTKRGTSTVVKTVEWIRQNYPNGVDPAEQVRTFIRDAYENWGTRWVLLGGDTDIVPLRYATHSLPNPPDIIPADYYFGCLDGNWNGDGDASFGEAGAPPLGDGVDLVPDVYAGRATVSTPASATTFVNKIVNYERLVLVNGLYPNSALLLCERLSPSLDGAIYGEDVRQRLPAGMRLVRMYEEFQDYPGALPESRNAVIDSLRAGFGIVHHVGHGFRNTMSVGDGSLANADIDNLTNGLRQSVVYAINCSSAAIDFNAIGERFPKNSLGGGVAYIGASRIASAGEGQPFQNKFYETVFQDSVTAVGKALSLSKLAFIGQAEPETITRWYMFALNLIGDPEMPIWRRGPNDIFSASAATFTMGSSTPYAVTATVGGSPLLGADVMLTKTGEVPASGTTNASGVANIPWRPRTTGSFSITVSKPDYRPVERTATVVSATGTFLYVDQTTINDDSTPPSSGNGDTFIDGGERVEVTVRLRNGGAISATSVTGTLSVLSGGGSVSVVNGVVSYGTIGAGGLSSGSSAFVLDFSPGAPDAFQPTFQIAFTSGQGASSDVFVLPMRGVELEHYSHLVSDQPGGNGNGIPEPGEAVTYRVTLRNTGNGRADLVTATARVLNRTTMQPDPQVTVTDPNTTFGTIIPLATVQGDPIGFTLSGSAVVANLLVELSYTDSQAPRGIQLCDLVLPDPVSDLKSEGTVTSIRLTWTRPTATDVRGYDVFRSPNGQSNWLRINSFTGIGSAVYEDTGLNPLTQYYYYIVARDSSFNASTPSAQIAANTTPPLASGWPIEMGQQTSAGVVIDDLDNNGDFELVTGADAIYAWHHDGVEVRDGDQNPTTSGVFSTDGQNSEIGFHSTPAIADLTGDGDLEIVGLAWREAEVYVWNLNGTLEPGWPQAIDGDFNWGSPVVEDLDFDGNMEIIAPSGLGGKIYAWHHNGLEVADGDENPFTFGVFYVTGTSFLYSSPAVGNIDGDVFPEVVFGTQGSFGKVIALKRTASLAAGWPVDTLGQITSSPALADLDFPPDGQNEIIIASESDSVYVLRGNGTNYPGWPRAAMVNSATGHTSSPVVADLDEDGHLDIIFAANNGKMHVWKRDGTPMPGWDNVFFAQDVLDADATQSTPTVANIDADHRLEIVLGAENRYIYAWNHDGSAINGFPITIGGEQRSAISIWDLDADGLVELVSTSNDRSIYVWDMAGQFYGDRTPWPFFRHDARNTGRYSAPLTSIGVTDPGAGAPAADFVPILHPAHPNPFNPQTQIRFRVPGEAGATRPVRLRIMDVTGRVVRELVDGPYRTGEGAVIWDGRMSRGGRAPSGAYFMQLEVGGQTLTGKLTLLQ